MFTNGLNSAGKLSKNIINSAQERGGSVPGISLS